MNVQINKSREFNDCIIDITAKENNPKDIAHMERVVAYLVEEHGYEEIAGDGDYNIILGAAADNTAEAREAYSYAKKVTK